MAQTPPCDHLKPPYFVMISGIQKSHHPPINRRFFWGGDDERMPENTGKFPTGISTDLFNNIIALCGLPRLVTFWHVLRTFVNFCLFIDTIFQHMTTFCQDLSNFGTARMTSLTESPLGDLARILQSKVSWDERKTSLLRSLNSEVRRGRNKGQDLHKMSDAGSDFICWLLSHLSTKNSTCRNFRHPYCPAFWQNQSLISF
jgi:hypothetical protein